LGKEYLSAAANSQEVRLAILWSVQVNSDDESSLFLSSFKFWLLLKDHAASLAIARSIALQEDFSIKRQSRTHTSW
jgi:hypothetical protein